MDDFRVEIPEEQLDDLRRRIRDTRWPGAETDQRQGVPLHRMRELADHWAEGYDWRRVEARLNALPQVMAQVDGLGIHALHVRSPHEHARPLLLTHGWPGSVLDYLGVIEPLTTDAAMPFHLVIPSLPGYGFSDKPTEPGWGVDRIARAWAELMTQLGYERFGAHGSDWGTSVTARLGQIVPERLTGIHLVPPLVAPDLETLDDLTEAERSAIDDLANGVEGDGYSHEMSTRPQTIGYSLDDSPIGLCAWIVEKLEAWSDEPLDREAMLDTVTLYWLTTSGASSARLYWESFDGVQQLFRAGRVDPVDVPAGCTVYPFENPRPSRRWAQRRFTDIRYWSEPERGGHFAALEQPESFVAELRACFAAF